jgi:hypothetical protein
MSQTINIAENIRQIQQKIAHCVRKYPDANQQVQLLAVSKTKPVELIKQAYAAGQKNFAESYLQEALAKISQLQSLPLCWHFIGHIQANKTRDLAQHFHWVHSVDRLKIARRLSEQRSTDLPPLNICLQINVRGESSKSGISLNELPQLAREVAAWPNLNLRGLMAIPERAETLPQQCALFQPLREALAQLNASGLKLDTLSIGMSNDMEAAIAEGATMVRIGSAIFGARE